MTKHSNKEFFSNLTDLGNALSIVLIDQRWKLI